MEQVTASRQIESERATELERDLSMGREEVEDLMTYVKDSEKLLTTASAKLMEMESSLQILQSDNDSTSESND
eukprot:scaffold11447_cov482-Chaetoceros_neogracile.AAC.1